MTRRRDERQEELPFAEAEGIAAERESVLGAALVRRSADLHLTRLMLWIAAVNAKGHAFAYKIEQVAERPWGLCCSSATARRALSLAVEYGWLDVEQTVRGDGSYGVRSYRINWDGLRASADFSRGNRTTRERATNLQGRPSQIASRYSQIDRAFKEYSDLNRKDNPPPQPPPSCPASPRVPSPSETGWEEAEEVLRGVGVVAVGRAVATAKARGLSPAEVVRVAETFGANRDRFTGPIDDRPGAILFRLENGAWPRTTSPIVDPDEMVRRRAEAERKAAADRRRVADDDEAERLRVAELERLHGPELDAMNDAERLSLLGPSARLFRQGGRWLDCGGGLRAALLERLASRAAAEVAAIL